MFDTFQLTLPMRGAITGDTLDGFQLKFQLTLPMRGAIHFTVLPQRGQEISTHAPHAGSDTGLSPISKSSANFNSRSPCGERFRRICVRSAHRYFNSRSPCGERCHCALISSGVPVFQLTLPMRGAIWDKDGQKHSRVFQLTLPMRGAILATEARGRSTKISTHAPHAGSDRRSGSAS